MPTDADAAPVQAKPWTVGHALIAERDAAQWRLADWVVASRRDMGRAGSVAEIAGQLNITSHKLRTLAKVATAFPPILRDPRLSFDVHAHLAAVPEEDRAAALARAAEEGWGERQAKALAVEHRQATAMFEDEDAETRFAVEIMRAWNRAPPEARGYFKELADGVGTALIDEDTVNG